MKYLILFFSLMSIPVLFSQENELIVYDIVDDPAQFRGGLRKARKYLSKNIKYPPSAIKNGKEGKCYLKFIVTDEGYISNVKVVRGIQDCPECDAEAIRVVKSMPRWKPGKVNGKPINSSFTLPIEFKLN